MRYQTELMRSILTNEKAQEIIDYVSPIYGESYVALWIYQAMGIILGEIYDIAVQLRHETTPATADLLLPEWEKHYELPTDSSLTKEQRQLRLVTKTSTRGPCNPSRLELAVSAVLGGVKVEIEENIAKNTFLVNIREVVDDITPAVAVLERMKPAHLIYQIRVATQMVATSDIKVAIATVHSENYNVEFVIIPERVTFTLAEDGTLIASSMGTLTDDGVLSYKPVPMLTEEGILF